MAIVLLTLMSLSFATKSATDNKPINACTGKTCSECIQIPTCAWCSMLVKSSFKIEEYQRYS